MDVRRYLSLLAIIIFTLLAFYGTTVEACSCAPAHPQTLYCDEDYAALIRVLRKSEGLVPHRIAYKVEIKKAYKMTDAGRKMLRHERILTPDASSSCNIRLEIGKLYVIAGRAPILNSCSYVKEYTKMTSVERRGFGGVYAMGCKCRIKPCFSNQCEASRTMNSCNWSVFNKCETELSACVPASRRRDVTPKCYWRRTPAFRACSSNP